MRTGSLFEVAIVLKGLTYLARKKALSFREKRMLDRAKYLLVTEIAEAEGKPVGLIEERVEKALSRTLAPAAPPVKPRQKPVAPRRTSDA
jgi:CarD family transcriptional regulator